MTTFAQERKLFFQQLGEHGCMVLSTSLHDDVTSRMMSFIIQGGKFYFQTDKRFRKYAQLKENRRVSLCRDNMAVEGICSEMGKPSDFPAFCKLYQKYFSTSYQRYTGMEEERLFVVTPARLEKWIYEGNQPYMEILDFQSQTYEKVQYVCQLEE